MTETHEEIAEDLISRLRIEYENTEDHQDAATHIMDVIEEAEKRGRIEGLKEAEQIATKEQSDCEKMAPVSVDLHEAWMACAMTAKGIAQKIAALSTAPLREERFKRVEAEEKTDVAD